MAPSPNSSRQAPSACFPLAHVRIISKARTSECKLARLAISNRIYWKEVEDGKAEELKSLLDFKSGHSLILSRVADDAIWRNVQDTDTKRRDERGPSLVVPGRLDRLRRWSHPSEKVKLVLTAGNADDCQRWLRLLRLRVAPISLLRS